MALTAPPRANRAPVSRAGSPLPTRERRPGYIALAVVLIVGLAAVGAWLYAGAGAKTPVIVMYGTVPVGQKIQRSDLTTVAVAGGITAIRGDSIDSIVGQTAAVTLLPDTILQRSMLRTGPALTNGTAQVGIAVKAGQIPADGLAPGDSVVIFRLPADDAAAASAGATRLTDPAVKVSAVRADPAQTGGTLVTVDVPSNEVGPIATANGLGHLSIVRVAG